MASRASPQPSRRRTGRTSNEGQLRRRVRPGLWPLSEAAENTFGTPEWPADIPVPQAGIEFDVESHEAMAEATAELEAKGYRILRAARLEWHQTTARLLSPEGLLVGIAHTPWMHGDAETTMERSTD